MEKILSVHFPKAAGSSLADNFRRIYGERAHFRYESDPVDPTSAWQIAPELSRARLSSFPEDAAVVHGHIRGDGYPDATFRLTFLREPVENLVSIYAHWKRLPPKCGHAAFRFFHEHNIDVLDLARFPALRTLMSHTYFGGVDMGSFDFIGFFDRRQEDLARLGSILSLSLDSRIVSNPTPPTPEREEILSDRQLLGKLRDVLRDDVEFYGRLRAARD